MAGAIAAASSSSYMNLASFVSVRGSSSGSSSNSSPAVPSPSPSASPSISSQKRFSLQQEQRKTLADQVQHFSTEFLESPPPARVWISPTRKKARDSVPRLSKRSSSRGSPGTTSSPIPKTISLLTENPNESLASLLDSEVSFLTAKDIVVILQSETRWRRALVFFDWVKSRSFPINSFVYNVMLKILRKAEQWEIGNALVEEMAQNGIPPDNVTYSTIISFAIRCGKMQEALGWFSKMQDGGCPPDSVTYSAAIDVLAKSGRMLEAEDLCAKMQQNVLPLDAVAYSQIMKLHGMQNDFDQMWNVYKEMHTAGMVPNVVTYNALISMLGNVGRSIQVVRLFNDMLGHKLKPTPVTLSLMFRTFSKTREILEAFKLYEQMKKEEWVVDTVVYNSLLSLCAQMGSVDKGEEVYKELLKSKVCQPDDWTWRTLVDMYVKGGKSEDAHLITKEMIKRGRSIDLPVYMNLLQGYGYRKDFKGVLELMDEIEAAKVPFDHMLAGALLRVFVLCEDAGAEERLPLLEKTGIVYPELKTVIENLLNKDVSPSNLKEDVRVMLSGAAEDCRRPFCNLLMDLCWVKQSPDLAQELLSIAISFGLYPDLQIRSPVEWCLRLRKLSFGAARTALQGWVSSLRAALQEEGKELPYILSIEVGLGAQFSTPESVTVMSTFIVELVKEMNAPFQESRSGWLTASVDDVKKWLLTTKSTGDLTLASVV